jgi:hypothetical protein
LEEETGALKKQLRSPLRRGFFGMWESGVGIVFGKRELEGSGRMGWVWSRRICRFHIVWYTGGYKGGYKGV